jgi:hypothetical protein
LTSKNKGKNKGLYSQEIILIGSLRGAEPPLFYISPSFIKGGGKRGFPGKSKIFLGA